MRVSPVAAVVLLVLVALACRLWDLGAQSLWLDEVLQVRMCSVPVGTMIREVLAGADNFPPLYHVLLRAVLWLGVASEFWIRGPSVMFGTAAVVLLYWLVRELAERRTALVAALLLAVSPLHVWYSQEARPFALAVMLALGATIALLRAVRASSSLAWAVYALLAAAALYTYLYVVFVLLAHGCWLLTDAERRKAVKRWFVAQGVVVLVFLPWALAFLQRPGLGAGLEKQVSPLMSVGYTLLTFMGGYSIGPSVAQLHVARGWQVVRPYLPLMLFYGVVGMGVGLLALRQWRRPRELLHLSAWMFGAPIVGALTVSALAPAVTYNVRYALIALPFFLAILAVGAATPKSWGLVALTAPLVGLSGYALVRAHTMSEYFKEDNRAAARYVAARARPTDGVLLETSEPFRYYFPRRDVGLYDLPRGLEEAKLPQEAARLASGHPRVWLVESRSWTIDPGGVLEDRLARWMEPVAQAAFPGAKVTCYRKTQETGQKEVSSGDDHGKPRPRAH